MANSKNDEEFHESLVQTMPAPTYRTPATLTDNSPTMLEQFVRLVATLLGLLIVIRFATNLFSVDRSFGFVKLINSVTDWAARPFQSFIPQPTITSGGVFDWPAVVAVILVAVVAALLMRLLHPRHT